MEMKQILRKFKCVEGCSDCCHYREYYPSVEYGKIGVLILPAEKSAIESLAKKLGIKVKIIPRLGVGKSREFEGPRKIIAYQMMGKNLDGNLCPFLDIDSSEKSPHGAFKCKIYENRPLACRAYPVLDECKKTAVLDGKCRFCCKFAASNADRSSLYEEIRALNIIKEETSSEKNCEVWRYATAIGEEEDKTKFLPEGWIYQNIYNN